MQRCAAGTKHSRGRAAFTDMQPSVNGRDVRAFMTTSSVKVPGNFARPGTPELARQPSELERRVAIDRPEILRKLFASREIWTGGASHPRSRSVSAGSGARGGRKLLPRREVSS